MKDLTIIPEKGFEIDTELSDLSKGIIKFKEMPKGVTTYKDVADKLFKNKPSFYIDSHGVIQSVRTGAPYYNSNMATTREQLESILALNKLCNVAEYLNDGWKPLFNGTRNNYSLFFENGSIKITSWQRAIYSSIYFKTKELALEAIEILGADTIKLALGVRE